MRNICPSEVKKVQQINILVKRLVSVGYSYISLKRLPNVIYDLLTFMFPVQNCGLLKLFTDFSDFDGMSFLHRAEVQTCRLYNCFSFILVFKKSDHSMRS